MRIDIEDVNIETIDPSTVIIDEDDDSEDEENWNEVHVNR